MAKKRHRNPGKQKGKRFRKAQQTDFTTTPENFLSHVLASKLPLKQTVTVEDLSGTMDYEKIPIDEAFIGATSRLDATVDDAGAVDTATEQFFASIWIWNYEANEFRVAAQMKKGYDTPEEAVVAAAVGLPCLSVDSRSPIYPYYDEVKGKLLREARERRERRRQKAIDHMNVVIGLAGAGGL